MRWDDVLKASATAAAADPDLAAIYGEAVRLKATAQDHTVPGLLLWLVTDTAGELWEPVTIQWDQWTEDFQELVDSERALRKIFDKDNMVTIGGVTMFTVFTDGESLVDDPDRAGFYGRGLRFRMSPIREDLRCGRST